MTDKDATDLRQEICDLTDHLRAAERIARAGHGIDLKGLDLRVHSLCDVVLGLPDPTRHEHLTGLLALQGALTALTDALRAMPPSRQTEAP